MRALGKNKNAKCCLPTFTIFLCHIRTSSGSGQLVHISWQSCWFVKDTMESWYSETASLWYDEPKANTWRLPVWVCYDRGSRHPLTAGVYKWSYKSEETLSLWPCQAYGSGCSCPPSPAFLSHVTTGIRTVWHPEETTRSSAKMLGGAGHASTGLSPSDDWSVATDRSAWRALRPVDGQA